MPSDQVRFGVQAENFALGHDTYLHVMCITWTDIAVLCALVSFPRKVL